MMLYRFAAVALLFALVVPQAGAMASCDAMVCCQPPRGGVAFDAPDCCTPEIAAETRDVPGEAATAASVNSLSLLAAIPLTPAPRHGSSIASVRRATGPDEAPPPPMQRRLSALSLLLI